MGTAVRIKRYTKAYTREKEEKENSIHLKRRQVSGFWLQVASLSDKDPGYRKLIYAMWKKKDLEIIPKIIIPLEIRAIPIALGNNPVENEEEMNHSRERKGYTCGLPRAR
jgi:hypothetical protein